MSFASLPLDYFAPGSGNIYARTAWDTSSTVVFLQTGDEIGHSHADWGQWQMWRGGRWLSRETSSYGNLYTGYGSKGSADGDNVIAHNGLLINPDSQGCIEGSTCIAQGTSVRYSGDYISPPVIKRLETQSAYLFAATDIGGAYVYLPSEGHPERSNPAVKSLVRDYIYVRDLETLIVLDRIETNSVGNVSAINIKRTFLAHCESVWQLTDVTHSICAPGNGQELRLTTLLPATGGIRQNVAEAQGATSQSAPLAQQRLEITDAPNAAQSYLIHVLQGRSSSGLPLLTPTLTDNGANWTVTLDSNHSLTLVKGMSSSGGSVTISGVTTDVRADVEPIAVTDNGPVWGP
jgi:hypothetical protein